MKTPKRLRDRHKPAVPPARGIVLGSVTELFEALPAELSRTGL